MTHLTSVPPVQESILDGLEARARQTFEAGPVQDLLELRYNLETFRRQVVVTIYGAVKHVMLDCYGSGDWDVSKLHDELWETNPDFGELLSLDAYGYIFPLKSTSTRSRIESFVLRMATAVVIKQLESDPDLNRESSRRHGLRETPEQLLRPSRSHRRRRTTQD
jgi:hypothetical protein